MRRRANSESQKPSTSSQAGTLTAVIHELGQVNEQLRARLDVVVDLRTAVPAPLPGWAFDGLFSTSREVINDFVRKFARTFQQPAPEKRQEYVERLQKMEKHLTQLIESQNQHA